MLSKQRANNSWSEAQLNSDGPRLLLRVLRQNTVRMGVTDLYLISSHLVSLYNRQLFTVYLSFYFENIKGPDVVFMLLQIMSNTLGHKLVSVTRDYKS